MSKHTGMKRALIGLVAASLVLPAGAHALASGKGALADLDGVTAAVRDSSVHLAWSGRADVLLRDGVQIAQLDRTATSFDDAGASPGQTHTYRVARFARVGAQHPASVRTPSYLVGAASRDITPSGVVNQGGYGLGDGSLFPEQVIGRGGRDSAKGEHIKARAFVIDDGRNAIAIADIEVQGWFAKYEFGSDGLQDMALAVSKKVTRLPVDHIVIASDHSHAAPDTLGVWGGPSGGYMDLVKAQVVAAITDAYAHRGYANLKAGHSDASDLVYNQSCTEALNQSKTPDYPGPDVCATPGKDGLVRVVQATTPSGKHPLTWMVFAAHATAGGGNGVHGDWPQFLSDALTTQYGGQGIAMVGALGGTQPCRTACAFTKKTNPGYNTKDRKTALVLNYGAHVTSALRSAKPVTGPVYAAQGFIREPLVGPIVSALFAAGKYAGAELLRSHESPWVVGQTIRTVVGAVRIGGIVINTTPGEGFPRIRQDVQDSLGSQAQEVIQLGLANDQLGYLISPAAYVPVIAAEVPVNDNIIFNVSPTIGDHVGCADIRLIGTLHLTPVLPVTCAGYDVVDAAGDPIGSIPVGGVTVP
ncbi:MAG: hypothetical protein JWO22_3257 [Frankiales bacterium]|nr:hypothetical protein [Frankiales bacterium]